MTNFFSLVWDVDPVAFSIGNFLSVHWSLVFSCVGLLLAFEVLLFQVKVLPENLFSEVKKPFSGPFPFFVLVVLAVLFGAKAFSLLFGYGADAAHLSASLSVSGGILFLISTCLLLFNKRPRQQALALDASMLAFLVFVFFYQTGNFFESNSWGKPTQSDKGVVFTYQPTALLVGIFDKVETANVNRVSSEADNQDFPLTLDIGFIKEVNQKSEVEDFINSDLKSSIDGFELVNSHLAGRINSESMVYEILEDTDGKLHAKLMLEGVARHPISLYLALLSIIVFLIITLLNKRGVIKCVGEKAAWVTISWFTLSIFVEYTFANQFNWVILSEKTLSLLLVGVAIYYLLNAQKIVALDRERI